MEIECINTKLLAQSSMTVKVVKVDSPTMFWVQLKTGSEDFQDLLEELIRRMTRRGHMLLHRPDHIVVGELVVIRENRGWQRGIVTDVNGDGTVAISLRDWGRNVERRSFEVYILEDRFCQLEWQGIPCGLAHTAPFSGSSWPRRARDLTRFLMSQQEGRMSILGTIKNEAALIKLEIRSGGDAHEYHQIDMKETLITPNIVIS
ncbi:TDRKH protein, partial [Acromyrmex charruanus]